MANKKAKVNQPQTKRTPRRITNEERQILLGYKREDIGYDTLTDLFAFTAREDNIDVEPKFLTNDTFILPKNALYNSEQVETTVGRYICNLFLLSPKILELIGYQNVALTKKAFGKLQNKIGKLLLEDKIDSKEVVDFIDRTQWFGFRLSRFLIPSLTQQLLQPDPAIEAKKKELLEKYQKAIDNNDIVESIKLEKELVEFSKPINASIPDMIIYDSGVNDYGNSYKNTSLMRGPMTNNGTGEVKISTSSLVEGIKPEEMYMYADMLTTAISSRALGTAEGGYEGKKMVAAFQDVKLGEHGSDCGTDLTIPVTITEKNKDLYMYRYIKDDKTKQLILLDDSNINTYMNKTVNMRTPMFCQSDDYCSKCMGEFYYMMGLEYFGMTLKRISTRVLNMALKQFHNMTKSITSFTVEDYIE